MQQPLAIQRKENKTYFYTLHLEKKQSKTHSLTPCSPQDEKKRLFVDE